MAFLGENCQWLATLGGVELLQFFTMMWQAVVAGLQEDFISNLALLFLACAETGSCYGKC